MHEFSPRARHPQAPGPGARGEWAAWLPLLFIGAMMFWTVALGLGGWSLMVVGSDALGDDAPAPTATAIEPKPVEDTGASERIQVQMEESQEPEDVNDNAGAAPPSGATWGGVFDGPELARHKN